jgi:hypothetical protein
VVGLMGGTAFFAIIVKEEVWKGKFSFLLQMLVTNVDEIETEISFSIFHLVTEVLTIANYIILTLKKSSANILFLME